MKFFVESDEHGNLYGLLKNRSEFQIIGFYESGTEVSSQYHEEHSRLSIYKAVDLYRINDETNFIVNDTPRIEALEKKINTLVALGVDSDDILIASKEFMLTGELDKLYKFTNYQRLPYMEYHVADHCNLNCKGCVHFAPLVDGEIFASFEKVKRDMIQLKSIVPFIDTIRILGGEPLLNHELTSYLAMTRELYPLAEINVVTNGILLKKNNDCLFEFLKNHDIGLDISLYPPMFREIDAVLSRINSFGITVTVSEPISKFFIPLDQNFGHAKFTAVHHCSCPNLYDGALYVCPIIAYLRYFNRAFGKKLNEFDGRIDIYDSTLTYDKLKTELHKVRELCDSCWLLSREYAARQKWEPTNCINISNYMTCARL